jgi:hypothetical protein
MSVLQKIATALDIPPEIISANQDVNWVTATDPYDVGSFERTRSRYMPRWRYVSGGKALHAFIDGSDQPACGVDPRRGRDRHPARWIDGDPNRRTSWLPGPRIEHGPCAEAVRGSGTPMPGTRDGPPHSRDGREILLILAAVFVAALLFGASCSSLLAPCIRLDSPSRAGELPVRGRHSIRCVPANGRDGWLVCVP